MRAKISEAAALLGALGASKGGHARAASLSARRRKEIARNAVQSRWRQSEDRLTSRVSDPIAILLRPPELPQRDSPWSCPDCGRGEYPRPDPSCNCHKPLMISIPAGQHIHINCPVHGDRIVRGSDARM